MAYSIENKKVRRALVAFLRTIVNSNANLYQYLFSARI